ncbi:MAG: HlyD family secretion protein [Gammaproteobacteria bacterium]|nr:HlyD family secretion protein [Gammaproteobacteria bacterium]
MPPRGPPGPRRGIASRRPLINGRRRWRLRLLLLWIVPAVVIVGAVLWYRLQLRYASTDNAYVKADKVLVSPEVDGYVARVLVSENERVVTGQPLLRLDEAALRIALDGARADLATARNEIASLRAQHAEKLAELDAARRDLGFAQRDALRQDELVGRQLVSQARADEAARALAVAQGRATVLQRDLAQLEVRLGGRPARRPGRPPQGAGGPRNSRPGRARSAARHTGGSARRHRHRQPPASAGDRLRAGNPALAIVADRGAWVEANFKETDLGKMRAGQPVEIEIDAYRGRRWRGSVESIAQATGAEFALLPAQNASGNWVKVVQRVPVRVAIQAGPDDPPLRAGMSAYVRVDTHPNLLPATSAAARQAAR